MVSFVNLAPAIFFNVLQVGMTKKCQGTDKSLFRPVPVLRNAAQVLPLEVVPVPRFLLGHQQKSEFKLVPVPYYRGLAHSLNWALITPRIVTRL